MIRFHCLACGAAIRARDDQVSRRVRCPKCSATVTVPPQLTGGEQVVDYRTAPPPVRVPPPGSEPEEPESEVSELSEPPELPEPPVPSSYSAADRWYPAAPPNRDGIGHLLAISIILCHVLAVILVLTATEKTIERNKFGSLICEAVSYILVLVAMFWAAVDARARRVDPAVWLFHIFIFQPFGIWLYILGRLERRDRPE